MPRAVVAYAVLRRVFGCCARRRGATPAKYARGGAASARKPCCSTMCILVTQCHANLQPHAATCRSPRARLALSDADASGVHCARPPSRVCAHIVEFAAGTPPCCPHTSCLVGTHGAKHSRDAGPWLRRRFSSTTAASPHTSATSSRLPVHQARALATGTGFAGDVRVATPALPPLDSLQHAPFRSRHARAAAILRLSGSRARSLQGQQSGTPPH